MKRNLLLTLLIFSINLSAQENNFRDLTFNQIHFRLNTIEPHFQDSTGSRFRDNEYNGSYTSASQVWISGINNTNQKVATADLVWSHNDRAWVPGPYTNPYDPIKSAQYNKIYYLTREQIEDHRANYSKPGYQMPEDIANWPPDELAPYHDVNNNQVYEPHLGDYPAIKGDMAAYLIRSARGVPGVSAYVTGVELRSMYYAFNSTDSVLERTVFATHTLINRGYSYTDFSYGVYNNGDIGRGHDDYVRTNVDKNALIFYNGDSTDGSGFGYNPPEFAIAFLSESIDQSMTFLSGNDAAIGDPSAAVHFYNYMHATWKDDSPQLYGGNGHITTTGPFPRGAEPSCPARFVFPGSSDSQGRGIGACSITGEWSEVTAGSPTGDRIGVISAREDVFAPGEVKTFDLAYIGSRNMDSAIDQVRSQYTSSAITEHRRSAQKLELRPNPVTSRFIIMQSGITQVTILNSAGQVILKTEMPAHGELDAEQWPAGFYIVSAVNKAGDILIGNFIKQ